MPRAPVSSTGLDLPSPIKAGWPIALDEDPHRGPLLPDQEGLCLVGRTSCPRRERCQHPIAPGAPVSCSEVVSALGQQAECPRGRANRDLCRRRGCLHRNTAQSPSSSCTSGEQKKAVGLVGALELKMLVQYLPQGRASLRQEEIDPLPCTPLDSLN